MRACSTRGRRYQPSASRPPSLCVLQPPRRMVLVSRAQAASELLNTSRERPGRSNGSGPVDVAPSEASVASSTTHGAPGACGNANRVCCQSPFSRSRNELLSVTRSPSASGYGIARPSRNIATANTPATSSALSGRLGPVRGVKSYAAAVLEEPPPPEHGMLAAKRQHVLREGEQLAGVAPGIEVTGLSML